MEPDNHHFFPKKRTVWARVLSRLRLRLSRAPRAANSHMKPRLYGPGGKHPNRHFFVYQTQLDGTPCIYFKPATSVWPAVARNHPRSSATAETGSASASSADPPPLGFAGPRRWSWPWPNLAGAEEYSDAFAFFASRQSQHSFKMPCFGRYAGPRWSSHELAARLKHVARIRKMAAQ